MEDDLDTSETAPSHPGVTKELVEQRVDDWKRRLKTLFREISEWGAQNNWRIDGSGTVHMNEELMQRFEVPPTSQPTLRLEKGDVYALFKPKALWVIGANGRIDLFTSKGTFIIVDTANRGDDPSWMIFRSSNKRGGEKFVPEMLEALV